MPNYPNNSLKCKKEKKSENSTKRCYKIEIPQMPKCLLVWMTYTTQWIIYECQAKCLSREHKELCKQMSSKCRLHMLYIIHMWCMLVSFVVQQECTHTYGIRWNDTHCSIFKRHTKTAEYLQYCKDSNYDCNNGN